MATWNNWTYPTTSIITGTTKINEADNKLQAGQNDIQYWMNGTGDYSGAGFKKWVDDYIVEMVASYSDDTVAVEW